jgi:hypothetical protein
VHVTAGDKNQSSRGIMKKQTLIQSSIIAAVVIAAILSVSMVNGSTTTAKPFIPVDPASDKNTGDAFTMTGNTRLPALSEALVDVSRSAPVTGQFIRIDPIGDKIVGDAFSITGTTDLPAGTEILFQVYPASFEPTSKDPQTGAESGEFTGATGMVKVISGTGDRNTWSADLDLSTFKPIEYVVTASAFTGDMSKGDYSAGTPSGRLTFTVHPAPVTAGTTTAHGTAVAGGILIDPIRDTTSGDLLVVSGSTNLSAGTYLLVKVIPVLTNGTRITGDFQNLENAAVTKVVQGPGINNRFSVALDTRILPAADHIVTVTEVYGSANGISSRPGSLTGSAVFNILRSKAGTGMHGENLSLPHIFVNPIGDIPSGDMLIATGTTNLPIGSELEVLVLPESRIDNWHPKYGRSGSMTRGFAANSSFSVAFSTEDLPPGEHILVISSEDNETTSSTPFTVR